MKSHLIAALFALTLLTPAIAQQRQPPTSVSVAAEPQWLKLVAYVNGLPEAQRTGHVNMLLNGYRYAADAVTTGAEDRWDTPLEFIARGAGDCEDFAIAKYFLLLEAGVAPELVRLAFAFYTGEDKALAGGAARPKRTHVVVLRYAHVGDRDPLVLDAVPRIVPLSQRDDLHLVFDFGAEGSYTSAVSESMVPARAIGKMMQRWTEVLDRMRADGGREAAMVALGNPDTAVRLAQATRTR